MPPAASRTVGLRHERRHGMARVDQCPERRHGEVGRSESPQDELALLAESATGLVLGMSLPDDKLPLMKTMKVNYVKRANGDLKAIATLSPEQLRAIENDERGDIACDNGNDDDGDGKTDFNTSAALTDCASAPRPRLICAVRYAATCESPSTNGPMAGIGSRAKCTCGSRARRRSPPASTAWTRPTARSSLPPT